MASSAAEAEVAADVDWRKSDLEAANGHQKRFEHILESGFRSDVLFIVGDKKKEIQAHKVILSTGSKVFDDLFQEDKEKCSFEVPDLEPEEFAVLLKFLYTGESPRNVEEYLPAINAASKYGVSDLVRLCGKLLGDALSPDSAVKNFQQAIKYGDLELEERALSSICKNGFKIIESAIFMELSVEELSKILKRDDLEVQNEAQLFEAVMNWGKAELKRQNLIETPKYLRSVLENVIYLVRFPQMDPYDYSRKVYSSQILLDSDYIALFMYCSGPPDTRDTAPSGPFNSKPRVAYSPRGRKFNLRRLVRSFDNVMDLATNVDTGKRYIPPTFQEHSIKLKADASIWVKSIGMNSVFTNRATLYQDGPFGFDDKIETMSDSYYYCDACNQRTKTSRCQKCPSVETTNVIAVMIQLKNTENKVLAAKTETVRSSKYDQLYHIQFDNPVYLRAAEWYIATFAVFSGELYANQYTAVENGGAGTSLNVKDRDGIVKKVNFEFQNDVNPRYTGITQGFIPEIGFMIE